MLKKVDDKCPNKNILKFLSGDYFPDNLNGKDWKQVLIYHLLFISDPTLPLSKVI